MSEEWLSLLKDGGALRALITAPGAIGRTPIDVQFRRNDEITFYAGMTAVLRLRLHRREGRLSCDASPQYQAALPRLFEDDYPFADLSDLLVRWEEYRAALTPKPSWLDGEGYWQAWCSIAFGSKYQADSPFLAVDREVLLAHASSEARNTILGPIQQAYRDVRAEITRRLDGAIGRSLTQDFGTEMDLLAVSPEGDLCIVELKDMDPSGIYCAPVQLGGYVELWQQYQRDQPDVAAQINRFIEQKQTAGLLPRGAPTLRQNYRIRPYLVIGSPNPRSGTWLKLRQIWEEMRRLRPGVVDNLEICRIEVSSAQAVSLTWLTDLVRAHGRITPPPAVSPPTGDATASDGVAPTTLAEVPEWLAFRDQLRDARGASLRDSEDCHDLLYAIERLGHHLLRGRGDTLAAYRPRLIDLAQLSPLAEIDGDVSHIPAESLYDMITQARNDALHQGAYARHLTRHAIAFALLLEDALMNDARLVRDFMVRETVQAYPWQTLAHVRQLMLANSFSYLPIWMSRDANAEPGWHLLSDRSLGRYLRAAPEERRTRLAETIEAAMQADARPVLALDQVVTLNPVTPVDSSLFSHLGDTLHVVIDPAQPGRILGVLSSHDLL